MSSSADTTAAAATAADAVAEVAALDPAELAPESVQTLMAAAVRAYGAMLDAGVSAPAFGSATDVTATDAVRAASAVLKGVNLETFELALWETWGGAPWTAPDRTGKKDEA